MSFAIQDKYTIQKNKKQLFHCHLRCVYFRELRLTLHIRLLTEMVTIAFAFVYSQLMFRD